MFSLFCMFQDNWDTFNVLFKNNILFINWAWLFTLGTSPREHRTYMGWKGWIVVQLKSALLVEDSIKWSQVNILFSCSLSFQCFKFIPCLRIVYSNDLIDTEWQTWQAHILVKCLAVCKYIRINKEAFQHHFKGFLSIKMHELNRI